MRSAHGIGERVEARRTSSGERSRILERQKGQHRGRAIQEFKEREAQPKRVRWGSAHPGGSAMSTGERALPGSPRPWRSRIPSAKRSGANRLA